MKPIDFYNKLLESNKFCESLGRLLLLSGKLESILKEIILSSDLDKKTSIKRATFGYLVKLCTDNNLIHKDLHSPFSFVVDRRNYLTHNLYPLFNEEIDISYLPRENLSIDDADGYFSRCVTDLISDVNFLISQLCESENHYL